MDGISDQLNRVQIAASLRESLEATIEQRVERYIEVSHQNVIPAHHFAAASTQCIELYRDGYFLSAVMVTQAVAEGIRKFVVERNGIEQPAAAKDEAQEKDAPKTVALLFDKRIISQKCADAFNRIWRSFRNDVHHMNPKVATIPFPSLAKRNIMDLTTIEGEIFAFKWDNGRIIPLNRLYWDTRTDGAIGIFLRLEL